jgi:hypothetical protein
MISSLFSERPLSPSEQSPSPNSALIPLDIEETEEDEPAVPDEDIAPDPDYEEDDEYRKMRDRLRYYQEQMVEVGNFVREIVSRPSIRENRLKTLNQGHRLETLNQGHHLETLNQGHRLETLNQGRSFRDPESGKIVSRP